MGSENHSAEISGWPKLVITYSTDPDKVAALLPPGIEPGAEPIVTLGIYCVPVLDEPEYGISTRVRADFDGIAETILTCTAPGPMPVSPASLPFRNLEPGMRLEPMGRAFHPSDAA